MKPILPPRVDPGIAHTAGAPGPSIPRALGARGGRALLLVPVAFAWLAAGLEAADLPAGQLNNHSSVIACSLWVQTKNLEALAYTAPQSVRASYDRVRQSADPLRGERPTHEDLREFRDTLAQEARRLKGPAGGGDRASRIAADMSGIMENMASKAGWTAALLPLPEPAPARRPGE